MKGLMILIVFAASPATAQSGLPQARYANTQLADPSHERAAKALMESLRCLVCQGQSIADSDADMRSLVRERMVRGEEPNAIRRWLAERHDDYISSEPRLTAVTAQLWLASLVPRAIGLVVVRASFRRRTF